VIEKHGKVQDIVRASLQGHFSSEGYSPADIIEWVKWFCSTYGSPVFYETPIPQDGAWNTDDPDYKVSFFDINSYFLFAHTICLRNPAAS
jgi:hypothetical protein